MALGASSVAAQPAEQRWVVLGSIGGDTLSTVVVDNGSEAASRAQVELTNLGYLYARVDSVTPEVIYVTPGHSAQVRSVEVVGTERMKDLSAFWGTRPGQPYDPTVLQTDLDASAQRYVEAGFPDAELVPRLDVDSAGVAIRVDVSEGAQAALAGVQLVGGRHASRALATRLAGLRSGEAFRPVDASMLRRELEATGLFASVGEPSLVLDANRQLVIQVPVEDAPPGTFDVVFGYLPSTAGTGGGIVGSGRLELRNPFGGGRRVTVALNRTPGLVSAFDLVLADPFVAGLPVGLAGTFSGYARDSTFSRQRLRAETSVRLAQGLSATLSISREAVLPGSFGAMVINGQQRVIRSKALYYGAGLDYRALDSPLNPTRGIALRIAVEQGRRRRTPDPALGSASSLLQRRLDLQSRVFVPTLSRQTVVLGADVQALLSDRDAGRGEASQYDEGELLRIGGANTLRGYNEDAFIGNIVARALAEYRFLLGPQTYAFGFGDLGLVDRPPLQDQPARRETRPGYGAGLQIRTGIGLATVTYALNPDLPASRGKVHVGLSVGL